MDGRSSSSSIRASTTEVRRSRLRTPEARADGTHTQTATDPIQPGRPLAGVLACLDGFMNIAMEQTEEYVNGQLKAKYGDAFIRGNNVLYISTTKRKA